MAHRVLGLLPPPTLADCENAISRALLRIRSNGVTREALARTLDCSVGTIDSASNAKSLLSFDSIALLAYHFPEQFSLIEVLWSLRAVAEPTVAERLERIERELDAIRREAA